MCRSGSSPAEWVARVCGSGWPRGATFRSANGRVARVAIVAGLQPGGRTGASTIDGSILANGIVYLANPAGIFLGDQAVVNAAGFYAAAGRLADNDFLPAGIPSRTCPARW